MLNGILLYVKDVAAVSRFYETHFGFEAKHDPGDRLIELHQPGGMKLMLHAASKGQKPGQSLVKLSFAVPDAAEYCAESLMRGLEFGPIHEADGYQFANAKDPAGNPISVSSRTFRTG